MFINLLSFIADFYFKDLKKKKLINNDEIFEIQTYFYKNLNNLVLYNMNPNTLINAINEKLYYE